MISLPNFKKSIGEVNGTMDAWLYLLNHAGDGKELPRFGNKVLGSALERIRIENANDELLTKQAKDMITQDEIDTRLAGGMIRAKAQGLAEGRAEGLAEGRAQSLSEALDILQGMNLTPEQISIFKAKLEAKQP